MISKMEEYKKIGSMVPGCSVIITYNAPEELDILYCSNKAEHLSGFSREELQNNYANNLLNWVYPEDQEILLKKFQDSLHIDDEFEIIYRQKHPEQGFIWIHLSARVIDELAGVPVILAHLLDVTKEMSNFYGIMEYSDRCICVIERNNKALLYANNNFYKLINQKPAQCIGKHCYEVLCGNPAFVDDDNCICFDTINVDTPYEYYNPATRQYMCMYGRAIMWGEHPAYIFYISDQTEEKHRENQLKSAQQRFDMALNNSDLYIWEYDLINNQGLFSEKAAKKFGFEEVVDNYPECLLTYPCIPPDSFGQLMDIDNRLKDGETGFAVEREFLDKNGQRMLYKVEYTVEKNRNDAPIRAMVCARDITEQRAREIHYEEEMRRKKIINKNITIQAIINVTRNKVVENDASNELLKGLINNATVNEAMEAVCQNFVLPEDREIYRATFSREKMLEEYAKGNTQGSMRQQFLHVSGWYDSYYDLIVNPVGELEAVCYMQNVTELVRSENIIAKLTSMEYDSIVTLDVETDHIHIFNQEDFSELSGYGNVGELFDLEQRRAYFATYCAPEELERVLALTAKENIIAQLEKMPVYTVLYTQSYQGVLSQKRNIYTYLDKSCKTILSVRQDVTDIYQKEQEQKEQIAKALREAESANKAKTDFLSRVSHDMRTPLNGILGLTTLLEDYVTDPKILDDLLQLEKSGRYLLNLVNDTLDVSKIESGKVELHPMVCEGKVLFDNVLSLVRPNFRKRNIKLRVKAEALPFSILYIDAGRLQQIVMNIIGNSLKFTPEGGSITFTMTNVSIDENTIMDKLVIEDTGVGMSPDFLPHLFEPFSQERNTMTSNSQGTGLGMSITKEIIELMGGSISVESTLGKGSTFTLMIPLTKASPEQIAEWKRQNNPDLIQHSLEGKHILLCEDHPLNATIATRLLEKKGVIIDWAENGALGVEKFNDAAPYTYDAILMDIRMPVLNGLDATKQIRNLDKEDAKTIPIVAMTANALSNDIEATKEVGMNAHLSKPIEVDKLYDVLQRVVG